MKRILSKVALVAVVVAVFGATFALPVSNVNAVTEPSEISGWTPYPDGDNLPASTADFAVTENDNDYTVNVTLAHANGRIAIYAYSSPVYIGIYNSNTSGTVSVPKSDVAAANLSAGTHKLAAYTLLGQYIGAGGITINSAIAGGGSPTTQALATGSDIVSTIGAVLPFALIAIVGAGSVVAYKKFCK